VISGANSGGGVWRPHADIVPAFPKTFNMLPKFPAISPTCFQPLE